MFTDSQDVNAMIETAIRELAKVDVLVNNAEGSSRYRVADFCEPTEQAWDAVFVRNPKAAFVCTRAVINHMIERGGGKIVNIGSGAGVSGSPRQTDYGAAKAGVIGFTKSLAKEIGVHGIITSIAFRRI